MKGITVLCFSVQTQYIGKFWFTSHRPKCSHSIGLQDSLIINISGNNASVTLILLRVDIHQEKVAYVATTFGWVCPAMRKLS